MKEYGSLIDFISDFFEKKRKVDAALEIITPITNEMDENTFLLTIGMLFHKFKETHPEADEIEMCSRLTDAIKFAVNAQDEMRKEEEG